MPLHLIDLALQFLDDGVLLLELTLTGQLLDLPLQLLDLVLIVLYLCLVVLLLGLALLPDLTQHQLRILLY
jgi:hypothetical protein